MKLLAKSDYYRIAEPLRSISINTLFARAVVEGHVEGRVFVDDPLTPSAAYVVHPYGMSLLFGSTDNEAFKSSLCSYLQGETQDRSKVEWLQVFPHEWSAQIEAMLGEHVVKCDSAEANPAPNSPLSRRIVQHVRVNFMFNAERYRDLRRTLELPPGCEIVDDLDTLYAMPGSVVPRIFWDSAGDLRSRGAAFGVSCNGELASTAFASFVIDDYLELGIETADRFRGQGLAVHACSALIDDSLARGLVPVWACRLGNVASYRLALKLGFDHAKSLPYYRLPVIAPSSH